MIPTREEALSLLMEYNTEPFHIKHALTVEGVMRYFAKELGYDAEEEFWGIVGLLHDLDFEKYPEQHCIMEQEIMRERGADMLGWTLDDLFSKTILAMRATDAVD